jgi:thiamine pyrophosphokinase
MRCLIFLSGSIQDDQPVLALARQADRLICADGGIRHARRLNIKPDLLIGDMDSATAEDLAWIRENKIPVRRFSPFKDETDSELAVRAAMEFFAENGGQHQITLAGALGSRPDHVLAIQLLAARLAAPNRRFVLTDGRSCLYTLSGQDTLVLDLPVQAKCRLSVSVIPVSDNVSGLTYEGLQYPQNDAKMMSGSTRGISNHVIRSPVTIRLGEGSLLIIVTPEE